ncbi:carboxypeptidase regulatory-like domain-containing protein [Leptolyngbya sp. 7M]|uniref:TonB-dependent receptor n=1 Tax=Leptolyngbya sp. 7M TaxID=2812896 RepID=UPI001B8C9701|nr:carboxypeptidase regulatory-like domain-containing protein [Leptolyngbya sp. 7M]QYO66260.1 carboxypeptidase regulatory-like domain-containing protein [Leptolyngbya sp. 7M]
MNIQKCFQTIIVISVFSLLLNAQQPTGTLSGIITDPNNAVLPGAIVTVIHPDSGTVRTATTDRSGRFVMPNLRPGSYTIRVVAAGGFEPVSSSGALAIGAGQTVTFDASLAIGHADYEIDVEVEWPSLVRLDSPISGQINNNEIENLPLNGRNFLELALLTPGNTVAPNFDPTKTNTVVISSAGQVGRGGSVTIEGADNNDDVVGGALINIPQDAVQEFQVATNRFSAEYGRTGSGLINVVTKSGSNALRGSASFFARDKALQGLPATFDRSLEAPPFDRQQYAFTLGGPFIKNKFFGFGAFEYRDQDGATLIGIRDVPNRVIRRGFAESPLNDLLLTTRFDINATQKDRLGFSYAFQDADARGPSKLDRAIGSAYYLQDLKNRFHSVIGTWSRVFSPNVINEASLSFNKFANTTDPIQRGRQYTFPSILDGTSFRVPQATKQDRIQFSNATTLLSGKHIVKIGGTFQHVASRIDLGVFQDGRIEFVQDFANFDRNNDGVIDDNDLLFAVTLRSQFPDRPLSLDGVNNKHFAFFVQDDWRARRKLTFNIGLRYEADTNVKNISGYAETNPLVASFYRGERKPDYNNFGPRVGFAWSMFKDRFVVRGGYGIYYDRVVLQLITLERGLDGRALPVAVRAGNALTDPNGVPIFLDANGRFLPFAPTFSNPFTGFILPGAGASGINIIDNSLQNPMVQQSSIGFQWEFVRGYALKMDYLHNFGTHFIIGRDIGVVNNPVVGGPDRVVNLESSVKTKYDGLLVSVERRFRERVGFRASYTLSKAFNYANDDQVPFSNGPVDPNNLYAEYGPPPNDQRHRFTFAGTFELPFGFRVSPILTLASGVPMDILMPGGQMRIPEIQRNAGGRLFKNAGELNAYLTQRNAGNSPAAQLPLAPANARFNDNFSSLDVRFSKIFRFTERMRLEPIIEVFNLFNTTNILGVSNTNFSGFGNVLGTPSFGQPITTAGGVFGSGGPRAFQIGGRFVF